MHRNDTEDAEKKEESTKTKIKMNFFCVFCAISVVSVFLVLVS